MKKGIEINIENFRVGTGTQFRLYETKISYKDYKKLQSNLKMIGVRFDAVDIPYKTNKKEEVCG